MKKIFSVLLMIVLCISFASCSKNEDGGNSSEDILETETAIETTEVSADVTTDEDTTVEDTTEAPYDWKADALTVLSQYIDTDAMYFVYDMNNDGIPEIIVTNGTTAADTKYYLYDLKNSTDSPVEFGSGNCVLCGFDGDIILQYCKMGFETITKYEYDGEKLNDEVLLDREVPLDEDYLSLKVLNSFSVNDMSGFSWTENPSDFNSDILSSAK